MKTIRWLTPAFCGLMIGTIASAQDNAEFQFSSTNVRLLNERISDVESQLASIEAMGEPAQHGSCQKCGKQGYGGSCYCNPCPGLFADAELLLLYWHDTDDDDGQNAVHSGSRYTIGYMTGNGRALRARYFEFASVDDVGGGDMRTEHIDLEYAGRFTLGCNWQGEISLGGRWASLRTPQVDLWQDTIGPLLGVGVSSEITDWLALYGRARQSFQFGREVTGNQATDTFGISELALGVELSRPVGAAEAFLRTGFEAQYYSSVRDDEEDYGLVGYTIAAGFRR